MNKIYVFTTLLEKDSLINFCDFLNNKEGNIDIYLNSSGGDWNCAIALCSIVNKNPDRFTINTFGTVSSAAFDLLLYTKCEKVIGINTSGMTHQSSKQLDINSSGLGLYHSTDFYLKNQKREYAWELGEFLKMDKILGTNNLRKFKQGQEIWFDTQQIIKLLKHEWNLQE